MKKLSIAARQAMSKVCLNNWLFEEQFVSGHMLQGAPAEAYMPAIFRSLAKTIHDHSLYDETRRPGMYAFGENIRVEAIVFSPKQFIEFCAEYERLLRISFMGVTHETVKFIQPTKAGEEAGEEDNS